MAAAGCSADGERLPKAGLAQVQATVGLTLQGTAAVRIIEEVLPDDASGGEVIAGRWDFERRQGTFEAAGTTLVVAHGAEYRELSADERAQQSDSAAARRHRWSQRTVITTDDVSRSDYFGLGVESVPTFADAFTILERATAADDLGQADVGGVPTRHLRVTVDTSEVGAEPPEVWLDREGRTRRLGLSAEHQSVRLTLVIELSDFGTEVAVQVPPIDQLDPSGGVVPVEPWEVVRSGEEAGRPWRVRVAGNSRTSVNPPAQGQCLAMETEPFDPAGTPPIWYDCHPPVNPVGVNRVLPPALRGQVMVGVAQPVDTSVPVTFTDGSTTDAPVVDAIFVLFTGGRTVATIADQSIG